MSEPRMTSERIEEIAKSLAKLSMGDWMLLVNELEDSRTVTSMSYERRFIENVPGYVAELLSEVTRLREYEWRYRSLCD